MGKKEINDFKVLKIKQGVCVTNRMEKVFRNRFTLFALLLTIIHFSFLILHFAPAISTPDAQGYFCQAKLIAREARTSFESESLLQYMGPHWFVGEDSRYYTTFPPGLPLLLAVIYNIFGYKAALLFRWVVCSSVTSFYLADG
jgi:hypothetical protein